MSGSQIGRSRPPPLVPKGLLIWDWEGNPVLPVANSGGNICVTHGHYRRQQPHGCAALATYSIADTASEGVGRRCVGVRRYLLRW